MALTDVADGLEALGKLTSFWLFVGVPSYRTRQLTAFRGASPPGKALLLLEAILAAVLGLGLPTLLIWLIVSW